MAGFGLNLKLVLYLQNQCLTESLGFLNPPHRQAAKRCVPFYRTFKYNEPKMKKTNTNILNFQEWTRKLEKVWDLKSQEDCSNFSDLMYSLNGTENIEFAEKIIDTVRLKNDEGLYEALYNALWTFPKPDIGKLLARRLPDFQKRMGKYGQVQRFYLLILTNTEAQKAFIDEAKKWTVSERRTAISAIKKWTIEIEDWESVLTQLGNPLKKTTEDPIPNEWNENWKKRLEKGRKSGGEYCISGLVWNGGKKQWIEDLDFIIELLAINHGKHWRQVDDITNPIWGFANKILYAEFLNRIKALPNIKKQKIFDHIKKVSNKKYELLNADLNHLT